MKKFIDIDLGYNDATNYRNAPKKREMFNSVFVQDDYLRELTREDTYFLIGEKGTGKTAYATYLENNTSNTISKIVDISQTDYREFMKLHQMKLLTISDYSRIWQIIILLIMTESIKLKELEQIGPRRSANFEQLQKSINNYYNNAFKPEVATTIRYILNENSLKKNGVGVKKVVIANTESEKGQSSSIDTEVGQFQTTLLELEKQFREAYSRLKVRNNRFIFIDNVDVIMTDSSNKSALSEYYSCITGLADAVWSVNTSIFRTMPQSSGFLKVVLLIRPDILSNTSLHNLASKIRDNSILLDWRTTYNDFRASGLFRIVNRLLAYNNPGLGENEYWDYYFPWFTNSTNIIKREFDSSFINCLRLSLSRPRDFVTIMKSMQESNRQKLSSTQVTSIDDFTTSKTQHAISNYYVNEAKDWCSYKIASQEFKTLLFFFTFMTGKTRFSYDEFLITYKRYVDQVDGNNMDIFDDLLNPSDFLQLLYELNMICYFDNDNMEEKYRFCYREREISNLNPRVKIPADYGFHKALYKALNLG